MTDDYKQGRENAIGNALRRRETAGARAEEKPGPGIVMIVDGRVSHLEGTNTIERACAIAEAYLKSDRNEVTIQKKIQEPA